jgi:hypothetical protein
MMQKKQIVVAIACSLISFQSRSITYGSTTTVALVTANQAIASNDATNQIIGFSEFVGGITIPNATTVCRYNNYFPFYGPLVFNGGLLNLNRNLTLGSNATMSTGAQFNGNGFSLSLPTRSTNFVISSGTVMGNLTLHVNSPMQLTSVLTFTNTCMIQGNYNIIDCTAGALAVGSGGSLLIQNATLKGLNSNSFYCYDNTGTVTLENVTGILNSTLTFSHGRIEFLGSNLFTSTQSFVFQSTVPATIHTGAKWAFDSGMTFSYAAAANNLVLFDDLTAILQLYETTLYANTPGLALKVGELSIIGSCAFINDAASSANGISIGDGVNAANNLILNVFPESGITVTRGFFVNNNV